MKVVWISYFPVEWLADAPEVIRALPRQHPATWQRVLLEEFERREDLELHIVTIRTRLPQDVTFKIGRTTFYCLRVPPGMRTLSLFWLETIRIRRLLERIQPDLVHAWGAERGAALVASRLRVPYLLTMQGLLQWCGQYVRRTFLETVEARLEDVSLRHASFVTAESCFALSWLHNKYPHLQLRQVEHVPNPAFSTVSRKPGSGPIRFLFVGRLCLLKGTDLLIQALDRLVDEFDFQVTLIGSPDPGLFESLRQRTSPRLWERITVKDHLSPAEIAAEMAEATMMLFPTRVDNSPNSVKEAVAAGLPVVASNVGGIPDYVKNGLNGLLFEPGKLESFTQAVREAVNHPLLGCGKVDTGTLAQTREYLSPGAMRDKFLTAYRWVQSCNSVLIWLPLILFT